MPVCSPLRVAGAERSELHPAQTHTDMADRADAAIVKHLTANQYHPRSSKHGDALCRFLLLDLLATCEAFRKAAEHDSVVFSTNFTIDPNSVSQWNADLVVGPPTHPPEPAGARIGPIARASPTRAGWMLRPRRL